MITKAAIDLIKRFEGCCLSAYLCPAKIPTIGYGHTDSVKLGDTITAGDAERLLLDDLRQLETQVRKLVTVPLTDNQLGALVSFAYNVGIGNFRSSTLLKMLNDGCERDAANQLLKWDKATVKGKKVALTGLTKRRKAERFLFLS